MAGGEEGFIVIRRFMIKQLKLQGVPLLLYARIYGFTVGGGAGCYESQRSDGREPRREREGDRQGPQKSSGEKGLVVEVGSHRLLKRALDQGLPRREPAQGRWWDNLSHRNGLRRTRFRRAAPPARTATTTPSESSSAREYRDEKPQGQESRGWLRQIQLLSQAASPKRSLPKWGWSTLPLPRSDACIAGGGRPLSPF